MYKIFLISFILLLNFSLASDDVVKINIKYNEAQARVEAFLNVDKKISKVFYKKYLKDKNKKENLEYIEKENYEVEALRVLCPFYLKDTLISYAVLYNDEPQYAFYYNIFGNLIKFDIVDKFDYPRRTLGYSRFGNLISVSYEVSVDEQFVYNENGKLISHWVGDEVLDKDNKIPKMLQLKRAKNK